MTSNSNIDALRAKCINDFRVASKLFADFIKSSEKHRNALVATIETGTAQIDSLQKLCSIAVDNDDVGASLKALGKTMTKAELKRQESIIAFSEQLISAMKATLQSDIDEFEGFEKSTQNINKQLQANIVKMEKSATSAGKKDPKELQNALAAVRNAVTTSEQQSATQLERLLLMRRRRYCQFITEYLAVLDKMRGLAAVITQAHERHHDKWHAVTRGIEQLPPAARAVVDCKVARERTLIAIGTADVDEDGLPVDALCRARALYDCEPDELGDLRFSIGDIITVLAKDEATGWWTGTCHGAIGIFPSIYCVQLINE